MKEENQADVNRVDPIAAAALSRMPLILLRMWTIPKDRRMETATDRYSNSVMD